MLHKLDLPPIWLILFIVLARGLDRLWPGLASGWNWLAPLGWGLVAAGAVLIGLALVEFVRHKTSFIPRRAPSAFLRAGIYRFSRNPIYLGDALILAGLILVWDILPALVLVPLFMTLIARRFIAGEEAGLEARFGAEFRHWKARVRRWL